MADSHCAGSDIFWILCLQFGNDCCIIIKVQYYLSTNSSVLYRQSLKSYYLFLFYKFPKMNTSNLFTMYIPCSMIFYLVFFFLLCFITGIHVLFFFSVPESVNDCMFFYLFVYIHIFCWLEVFFKIPFYHYQFDQHHVMIHNTHE